MPQNSITFTTKGIPELERTIKRYAELNLRKTLPEIVNAKTLDMGYRSLQETDRANKAEIKNLPLRPWWVKYIAKRLSGEGVGITRKATKGERFVSGKRRVKQFVQGHYTHAQAKLASAKIIGARLRTVAFIASGWIPGIREFERVVGRKERPAAGAKDAKVKGQPKGYGKPHIGSSFAAIFRSVIGNTAVNPKRGDPNRLVVVATRGAEKGVRDSVADMNVYIARKMKEAAQEAGVPLKDSLTGKIYIPS